jgi:hypothetical protein
VAFGKNKNIDKGIYADDDTVTPLKNTLTYTRKNNADMAKAFTLSPTENCDYAFTISSADTSVSQTIKVYKESISNKKLVACLSEEATTPKGVTHYALEGGKTYYIVVESSATTNTTYTLTAEQDNWVYAPKGGKWSYTKGGAPFSALAAPNSRVYITPELLIDSTCRVLPDNQEYEIYTCYTEDDVTTVMANLTYEDPNDKMDIINAIGKAMTYGGVVILVISVAVVPEKSVLIAALLKYAGSITTISGAVTTFIIDILKLEDIRIKEVIQNGNFSIVCSHFSTSYGNVWDEWANPLYINKYQLGNKGNISKISIDDINEYCDW